MQGIQRVWLANIFLQTRARSVQVCAHCAVVQILLLLFTRLSNLFTPVAKLNTFQLDRVCPLSWHHNIKLQLTGLCQSIVSMQNEWAVQVGSGVWAVRAVWAARAVWAVPAVWAVRAVLSVRAEWDVLQVWLVQLQVKHLLNRNIFLSISCFETRSRISFYNSCMRMRTRKRKSILRVKRDKMKLIPWIENSRWSLTHRYMDTQTYIQADIQTHSHTDTQTHGHTDTQTHGHTDTRTHGHADTRTHGHKCIVGVYRRSCKKLHCHQQQKKKMGLNQQRQ